MKSWQALLPWTVCASGMILRKLEIMPEAAIVSVLKEWPYVAKIFKERTEKDPSQRLQATDGSDEDHRSDQ